MQTCGHCQLSCRLVCYAEILKRDTSGNRKLLVLGQGDDKDGDDRGYWR